MSAIIPEKCEECEGEYALLPCPFCGRAVTTRFNAMTGKHYISHEDWNSSCPQRSFYGSAEQWNTRHAEDALRAALNDIVKYGVVAGRLSSDGLAMWYKAKAALDAAGE